MNRPLPDRDADALLSGHAVEDEEALAGFVSEALALTETPVPSAALLAMLDGGLVPDATPVVLPRAQRARRLVFLRAGVVGGLAFSLVVGAASANVLPAPAQTVVADAVQAVTPIHLPRPKPKPMPARRPAVAPTSSPSPTEVPSHRETPSSGPGKGRPAPTPRSSDDPGRDGSGGHHRGQPGARPTGTPTPGGEGDHHGGRPRPTGTPPVDDHHGDDGGPDNGGHDDHGGTRPHH